MPTEFTVRGSHSAFQQPERATAQVSLSFEGPKPQPVYDHAARDLELIKQSIAPLHDPKGGPVTWWSTQRVRTWAQRPWNKDGVQLPLVHHASVGAEVKFSDFAVLAQWIGKHVSATSGFRLDGVVWALTEKNRQQLEHAVRARAVQNAARRAQEYADALELGPVRPVAIADAGMLERGIAPINGSAAPYQRMAAMAKESGGATEMELMPADIEVSAEIDARFVTE